MDCALKSITNLLVALRQMQMNGAPINPTATVAGIDIGGDNKGCHLVVLKGYEVICSIKSSNPTLLVDQCRDYGAVTVGIDSPCKWSKDRSGRSAEREMAKDRIFSFSTPTRHNAEANISGFYGWMFSGERIYQALSPSHPLLSKSHYTGERICFETFPHAITCAMLGTNMASAKRKRVQRRQLLEDSGVCTRQLKSIDAIDAALCALTAQYMINGLTKTYGDSDSGYIFVPALR